MFFLLLSLKSLFFEKLRLLSVSLFRQNFIIFSSPLSSSSSSPLLILPCLPFLPLLPYPSSPFLTLSYTSFLSFLTLPSSPSFPFSPFIIHCLSILKLSFKTRKKKWIAKCKFLCVLLHLSGFCGFETILREKR